MKLHTKILFYGFCDRVELIMCRYWHAGIKLLWYRLWIRKDEFHSSLHSDFYALMGMSRKRRDKYYKDLMRRREIAHRRDLECSH